MGRSRRRPSAARDAVDGHVELAGAASRPASFEGHRPVGCYAFGRELDQAKQGGEGGGCTGGGHFLPALLLPVEVQDKSYLM